ncbi:hypothetical protein BGZ89_000157 [Linnemannia elongata]|nr:hypothetical protein BGZ89_000157 [Linnemannia elongata]
MSEFAETFKYSHREDADRVFSALISKSFLRKSTRHTLQSNYEVWKRNEGDQFWASLEATTRVATDLVVGSVPKARKIVLGDNHQTRAKQDTQAVPAARSSGIPDECRASTLERATEDPASPLDSYVLSQDSARSTHIPGAAGQKHPRDPWGELDEASPKTPRNASPSTTIVPTENIDSPPMIQSGDTLPNPFLDNNADEPDDDEQLDAAEEDEDDGQDFLLPDKIEREFDFVGNLDGWDLATGFKPFFAEVKKKAVYIEATDEALGRSGIVFLANDGSALQKEHFGTDGLAQIRQRMLKYWHTADVTASRNKARVWLDVTDKNYDRSEILIELAKNPPTEPIDRKLWVFLVGAVSKLPVKDMTKLYSESTGLSSYVLPLCQAFMGDPEKMVFLNFVDKTTVSGKSRTGTKSKREPDLVLELKDKSNKTLCELGIGEGTSHAHKNYKKKNAKDLARIGLGLKDALDLIQDKYGVDDAALVGYQVIAQTMSIYLMRRCGNMYVMIHVHDVLIPDSMKELAIIGAEYNIWFELALTVERGIKPVLNAAAKGKVAAVHPPLGAGKARFHTVLTPELNKLLKRA